MINAYTFLGVPVYSATMYGDICKSSSLLCKDVWWHTMINVHTSVRVEGFFGIMYGTHTDIIRTDVSMNLLGAWHQEY